MSEPKSSDHPAFIKTTKTSNNQNQNNRSTSNRSQKQKIETPIHSSNSSSSSSNKLRMDESVPAHIQDKPKSSKFHSINDNDEDTLTHIPMLTRRQKRQLTQVDDTRVASKPTCNDRSDETDDEDWQSDQGAPKKRKIYPTSPNKSNKRSKTSSNPHGQLSSSSRSDDIIKKSCDPGSLLDMIDINYTKPVWVRLPGLPWWPAASIPDDYIPENFRSFLNEKPDAGSCAVYLFDDSNPMAWCGRSDILDFHKNLELYTNAEPDIKSKIYHAARTLCETFNIDQLVLDPRDFQTTDYEQAQDGVGDREVAKTKMDSQKIETNPAPEDEFSVWNNKPTDTSRPYYPGYEYGNNSGDGMNDFEDLNHVFFPNSNEYN
eukprot:TRINITY_DN2284_c5_g1_i2.p1 TRINITY_DN2284_c5_g1~~TRINITY_DN2284_c5_g1_i2.p1  ORF type:complete len:374 (-),score=94.85 TRINITY_DN2284_c5_g1_i2:66-1187(-)